MSLNREGKTYRNKGNDALVVVIKSVRKSAGTARHTILVLDPANAVNPKNQKPRQSGEQAEIDEVPPAPWDKDWEEV